MPFSGTNPPEMQKNGKHAPYPREKIMPSPKASEDLAQARVLPSGAYRLTRHEKRSISICGRISYVTFPDSDCFPPLCGGPVSPSLHILPKKSAASPRAAERQHTSPKCLLKIKPGDMPPPVHVFRCVAHADNLQEDHLAAGVVTTPCCAAQRQTSSFRMAAAIIPGKISGVQAKQGTPNAASFPARLLS